MSKQETGRAMLRAMRDAARIVAQYGADPNYGPDNIAGAVDLIARIEPTLWTRRPRF